METTKSQFAAIIAMIDDNQQLVVAVGALSLLGGGLQKRCLHRAEVPLKSGRDRFLFPFLHLRRGPPFLLPNLIARYPRLLPPAHEDLPMRRESRRCPLVDPGMFREHLKGKTILLNPLNII